MKIDNNNNSMNIQPIEDIKPGAVKTAIGARARQRAKVGVATNGKFYSHLTVDTTMGKLTQAQRNLIQRII